LSEADADEGCQETIGVLAQREEVKVEEHPQGHRDDAKDDEQGGACASLSGSVCGPIGFDHLID
jgi:hypothetical protein